MLAAVVVLLLLFVPKESQPRAAKQLADSSKNSQWVPLRQKAIKEWGCYSSPTETVGYSSVVLDLVGIVLDSAAC